MSCILHGGHADGKVYDNAYFEIDHTIMTMHMKTLPFFSLTGSGSLPIQSSYTQVRYEFEWQDDDGDKHFYVRE